MGLLGRKITAGAMACVLLLGGSPALSVQAQDTGDRIWFSARPGSPTLSAQESWLLWPVGQDNTYEVAPGDSLWRIAKMLWGDGRLYWELYEQNRETVENPDLIYPGELLYAARPLYLEKQSIGMEQKDVYRCGAPYGSTVGLVRQGDAGASCVWSGRGDDRYDIACMIREREPGQEELTDYEAWDKAVRDYAEEQYGDAVRDLAFEHYLSENGEPVWLYSYIYEIGLSQYGGEGSVEVMVCAGVRQTGHMQAEFLGCSMGQGSQRLTDRVRYMTASFEDCLPAGEECTVNDNNIVIYPSVEWEADSFNAFAWVDQYYNTALAEITGYREESKSGKEKKLDQMREGRGVYDGKEKNGN